MGALSASQAVEKLETLGCTLRVEGERLKVRGPDLPEVAALLSELRTRRHEAIQAVRERENGVPTVEELEKLLPPTVRVIRYEPKTPPVAVAPVSVVTNVGRFIRSYVADLGVRLKNPDLYCVPPLTDILSKLADVGLELRID